ncbi:MAG: methyltransferase domain-containing protein [bacterium]|nr:methyltransferase domain-containing protein [bacterium]
MNGQSFYTHAENLYAHSSVPWQQEIVHDFFTRICGDSLRVLDAGAGIGNTIETIAKFAAHITAVDISPLALRALRQRYVHLRNLEVRVARVEALPFTNGTFDVVLLTEVVEHCDRPEEAVAECARVLKPGGFLIISSPNYLNPAGLWKWWYERTYPRRVWDAWGNHEGGVERFTTSRFLRQFLAPHFLVLEARGGDALRSWLPFLRARYKFIDRHPFLWMGKLPFVRAVLMNYFVLAKKPSPVGNSEKM